ncbi:DUF2850 domain-containing protein [Vibrio sp. SG41-7]|uniref:DUF2850 domain-containing protein n=1 Tax=Vibrio TaxID=662 RepID=UPI001603DD59|nr:MULTISPECIES: DUF2850 domain-containing protein [Vibrio]MBB1463606.1 DUF2850 domain-containing protein [Vibrio sp. SG41-7]
MIYSNPNSLYGLWLELDVPSYQKEELYLFEGGVKVNHRLISTSFEFDGNVLTFHTGSGKNVYIFNRNEEKLTLTKKFPPNEQKMFLKQ